MMDDRQHFARGWQAANQRPRLTAEDEARLVPRAQAGDEAAMAELVERHARHVYSAVLCYVPIHADGLLDLLQEGYLGLIAGILGFELNRGHRLSTFVDPWVRGSILRALARSTVTGVRVPVGALVLLRRSRRAAADLMQKSHQTPDLIQIAVSIRTSVVQLQRLEHATGLGQVHLDHPADPDDPGGDPPVDWVADHKDRTHLAPVYRELRDAVAELPARQRLVIERHYEKDETLEAIGLSLGLSRPRIHQVLTDALNALYRKLN